MRITAFLLLFVSLSTSGQAQFWKKKDSKEAFFHAINPEYVHVNTSKAEFVSWAKSIGEWSPGSVRSTMEDRGFDEYYRISVYNRESPLNERVHYYYMFKNDTCIQVKVEPLYFADVISNVSKDHTYQGKDGEGRDYYLSKSGSYKVLSVEDEFYCLPTSSKSP